MKRELGGGTGRAGKESRKEGGEGIADGKLLKAQGRRSCFCPEVEGRERGSSTPPTRPQTPEACSPSWCQARKCLCRVYLQWGLGGGGSLRSHLICLRPYHETFHRLDTEHMRHQGLRQGQPCSGAAGSVTVASRALWAWYHCKSGCERVTQAGWLERATHEVSCMDWWQAVAKRPLQGHQGDL